MLDVDSLAGHAAHDAVVDCIFTTVASCELGQWQELTHDWDSLPSSLQAAIVSLNTAGLLLIEATRSPPFYFRVKLTAAGEALQDDGVAIMSAVADGKGKPVQIRPWIKSTAVEQQAPIDNTTPVRANTSVVFSGTEPMPDVKDLAFLLASRGNKSEMKTATEFTGGDKQKAKSLLAQIRRMKRSRRIVFANT